MRRLFLIAAAMAAPATAQSMNADRFTRGAEAIVSKGALALLDPQLPLYRDEARGAVAAAKAGAARAVATGRRPPFCLPDGADMAPDQFLAEAKRIPAAQRRRMTTTALFTRILARRFPCS